MLRLITITAISIISAACSSVEYRATYDQCLVEAYDRYPTNLQLMQTECSRDVEVDTGKTECVTTYAENEKRTVCGPLFETVTETYQCEVERDTNRGARELFARSCAANRCIETFGNRECETD